MLRWRKAQRIHFQAWMGGGKPTRKLPRRLRKVIAIGVKQFGLTVTSTYEGYPGDGVHASSSWHYKARAADISGEYNNMLRFQRWVSHRYGKRSLEIFGPGPFYYKNGVRYPGAFPDHQDHVHVAL